MLLKTSRVLYVPHSPPKAEPLLVGTQRRAVACKSLAFPRSDVSDRKQMHASTPRAVRPAPRWAGRQQAVHEGLALQVRPHCSVSLRVQSKLRIEKRRGRPRPSPLPAPHWDAPCRIAARLRSQLVGSGVIELKKRARSIVYWGRACPTAACHKEDLVPPAVAPAAPTSLGRT